MEEALRCVEYGLYRPARVAAWVAAIDFCHEWAADAVRLAEVQRVRPKWSVNDVQDFRIQTDFAFFEALRDAGLIMKSTMKAFHGLLNKRNECAHPEDYSPSINDTLGYLDELMKRIDRLKRVPTSTVQSS